MNSHTAPAVPEAGHPRSSLLRARPVRWLMAGAFITNLGDQFTLIALPWLVLQMSSDPLVLGTVLAVIGVPRALFILIGGAIVDRHSPHRILMLSKQANTVLLLVLAAGIWTGQLTLGALYALALGLGLAAAFAIPAATSMLPRVVPPAQLGAANGMMMGQRQLSLFVGPLLAGVLVAHSAANATAGDAGAASAMSAGTGSPSPGLALAFALDALSFAVSAWTLTKVPKLGLTQPQPASAGVATGSGRASVLASVAEGLRSFWADRDLRAFLSYGAVVSVCIAGPVTIALPVLASQTPSLGAAAFGSMLGAHGAGTLLGLAAAGLRPRWRLRTLGLTLLAIDATVGLLFMPLGHVTASWQGAGLLLAIGALGGFMQVLIFTWLQQRVAPAMMGRAMSLFMFIFVGLAPLSAAATGAILRWVPLTAVFAGTGALLVLIVVLALLWPGSRVRQLGPASGPALG
jgi:MFS family permease